MAGRYRGRAGTSVAALASVRRSARAKGRLTRSWAAAAWSSWLPQWARGPLAPPLVVDGWERAGLDHALNQARRAARDGDRGARSRLVVPRGLTRALRARQCLTCLVDQVALRGLVARLLGLVERATCLQEQVIGLRPGTTQRAIGVVADLRGFSLGIDCRAAGILSCDARLIERPGELGALPLGLAQGPLERAMELGEVRLGAIEDAVVEPEARGDREGVRRAGQTDVHPIRGTESLGIELDTGVHHAGRAERECLQLGVVRRRGDEDAAREERLEHGHRQGRALIGVCPSAELVEEREVALLRLRQRGDHVAEMRAEGRKALRDRLFVADVCEHPLHDGHAAAALRRDLEPARGHEDDEADGLERHRLAAG